MLEEVISKVKVNIYMFNFSKDYIKLEIYKIRNNYKDRECRLISLVSDNPTCCSICKFYPPTNTPIDCLVNDNIRNPNIVE